MTNPLLKLRIVCPGQEDQIVAMEGPELLIGRAADCDLVIQDRHISARHARLLAGPVIIDLESTNGTFVDGVRVRDARSLTGGAVHLGSEEGDIRIELLDDESGDLEATLPSGVQPAKGAAARSQETEVFLAGGAGEPRKEPGKLVDELAAGLVKRDQELSEAARDRSRMVETIEQEQQLSKRLREQVAELETRVKSPEEDEAQRQLQQRAEALEQARGRLQAEVDELRAALEEARERDSRAAQIEGLPMVRSLLEQDLTDQPASPDWEPASFLTHELLRFVRAADRIAGIPAEPGLSAILASVVASPEVSAPRRQLAGRMGELLGELEAALSYPAAAARFVEQLKDDLSASGLTRNEPLPALKQLSGQVEEELWLRATRYLESLTAEVARERLRALASPSRPH